MSSRSADRRTNEPLVRAQMSKRERRNRGSCNTNAARTVGAASQGRADQLRRTLDRLRPEGRYVSAHRLISSSAGRRARPASVSAYVTDSGGPSRTARETSPASPSSASRSESIESLIPSTARARERYPAGPPRRVARMTPVHRFPSRSNARTRVASAFAHSSREGWPSRAPGEGLTISRYHAYLSRPCNLWS
jgi:hypothetical protein